MSDPRPAIITRETLIPVGVAVAIMVPAIGGWTWLSRQLDSIDRRLEAIERQSNGAVHETDINAWIRVMRSENPSIKVPDLH